MFHFKCRFKKKINLMMKQNILVTFLTIFFWSIQIFASLHNPLYWYYHYLKLMLIWNIGIFTLYQQSSSTNFWVSFPVSCMAGSNSRCLTCTCGDDLCVMLEGAITALGGSINVSPFFPISEGTSYSAEKLCNYKIGHIGTYAFITK